MPSINSGGSSTTRAKIDERLQRAVNAAPPTKNRSPELVPLTAEYEKMKRNLRNLVTMVKNYGETTKAMNMARDDLVQHLSLMSQASPIFEEIGLGLDPTSAEALEQMGATSHAAAASSTASGGSVADVMERRLDTDSRSLAVVQRFGAAHAVGNHREYEQHVVSYAVEWEQAVTERVDRELKHVRKLQGDRDHYEKKVENLRKKANDIEAKGKQSPAAQVEKLSRNEDKLKEAFILHEAEAGRLCALIETVTRDGWLELYNLCRNYMKWESNRGKLLS